MESLTTREGNSKIQSFSNESLIESNRLKYRVPSTKNVVISRRIVKTFQSTVTYPAGQPINMVCSSGDTFIDPKRSYLKFDVTFTSGDATSLHLDSAYDLFSGVIITHSSGVEVSNMRQFNLFRRMEDKYSEDQHYFDTEATLAGVFGVNVQGTTATYVLPLRKLAGLFGVDMLLPSYLMSGLQIKLQTESAANALRRPDGTADLTYSISNVELACDTYILYDGILKELNAISASSGTEISFNEIEHHSQSIDSTAINIRAERALGLVKQGFVVTRKSQQISDQKMYSLRPDVYNYTEMQYRLGSQMLPATAVRTPEETYYTALYAWDANKKGNRANVSFADFKESYGVAAVVLERHQVLDHSGQPTSNQRALSLIATVVAGIGPGLAVTSNNIRTVDMFVTFSRLLKLNLFDRCSVSE
jgi:hypothetical protein